MRTKEYNTEYKQVTVTELPISENAKQRGWTHAKQIEEIFPSGTRTVRRMVFTQFFPEIAEEWDNADVDHTYYTKNYPA
jgi:hypothetical protein